MTRYKPFAEPSGAFLSRGSAARAAHQNGLICAGASAQPVDTLELYVVLSDRNRRRILELVREGERSVSDLVRATRLRQPLVSHHLRILHDAGLVGARKEGRFRIYRVASTEVERRFSELEAKAAALLEKAEQGAGASAASAKRSGADASALREARKRRGSARPP